MKKLLIAAAVILAAGCAKNNFENSKPKVEVISSAKPVYASFGVREDGTYYFEKFSFVKMKDSVNLNDLTHTYARPDIECDDFIVDKLTGKGTKKPGCNDDNKFHFMEPVVDSGVVAKNAFAAVVTVATYGILAKTFSVLKFNQDAFETALEQSFKDRPRHLLIEDFNNKYKEFRAESTIKKNALYSDMKLLQIAAASSIFVDDKSGLLITSPKLNFKLRERFDRDIPKDFTWKDASNLSELLQSELEEMSNTYKIILECDDVRGFHYTATGCGQTWAYGDVLKLNPVKYVVSSAKKYDYSPIFKAKNEQLEVVSIDSDLLRFTNMTNSFLKIDDVSIYIGNDIETISGLNISLPPGAVVSTFDLKKYNIYKKTWITGVTKKDLSKQISVGVAIKYKVVDANLERTLYQSDKVAYSSMYGYLVM